MTAEDLDSVAKIWLDTNVEVHSFIPSEYWKENLAPVKGMFLQAEMYVYEENREILGFIGLDQSYIAGIFVKKQHRSLGIGKALLDFVKEQNEELTLHVYQKNEKAVRLQGIRRRCVARREKTGHQGARQFQRARDLLRHPPGQVRGGGWRGRPDGLS